MLEIKDLSSDEASSIFITNVYSTTWTTSTAVRRARDMNANPEQKEPRARRRALGPSFAASLTEEESQSARYNQEPAVPGVNAMRSQFNWLTSAFLH